MDLHFLGLVFVKALVWSIVWLFGYGLYATFRDIPCQMPYTIYASGPLLSVLLIGFAYFTIFVW